MSITGQYGASYLHKIWGGGVVGVYGVMVGLGVRCVAVWCVFMGVRGVRVYVGVYGVCGYGGCL